MTRVLNLLTHEIAHQWSGRLHFSDTSNQVSDKLLQQPDLLHWNFYLDFASPLGGGGWQDNHNGTFTSLTSQLDDSLKKPLAPLDLYAMGLLPKQAIQPVHYLVTDPPNAQGNTVWAKAQPVTIDDIIAAEGPWRCDL
jgi:hypothetical protein